MEGAGAFRPLKTSRKQSGFSHGLFLCSADASYVNHVAKEHRSEAEALCKFPSIQGSKDPCSLRYEQTTGRQQKCEQALANRRQSALG